MGFIEALAGTANHATNSTIGAPNLVSIVRPDRLNQTAVTSARGARAKDAGLAQITCYSRNRITNSSTNLVTSGSPRRETQARR